VARERVMTREYYLKFCKVRLSCSTRGFPSFVIFFNLIFSIPPDWPSFFPVSLKISVHMYAEPVAVCCHGSVLHCVAEQCSAREYQHVCSM